MEHNGPTRPRSLGRYVNFAASTVNAMCNALLARYDLTLAQWVVLSALWQKDDLSVSEVADYTGNAGPAASRILDRMVEKGLLVRRQDVADRRSTRVMLTDRGEALRPLRSFYEEVNAVLLAGLDADDADALYALLERVTTNARAVADAPVVPPSEEGGAGRRNGTA
jgi:DNA-binding MarR family transcriptional regulator